MTKGKVSLSAGLFHSPMRVNDFTDIAIYREPRIAIKPFSRRGNEWMKQNSVSYRPPDNWNPYYSAEEADAIAKQAASDSVVVVNVLPAKATA